MGGNTLAWPINTGLLLGHAEAAHHNMNVKKYQHLHDDGFLGHFSLLFSDYKENSMNSMGLKNGKAPTITINFVK